MLYGAQVERQHMQHLMVCHGGTIPQSVRRQAIWNKHVVRLKKQQVCCNVVVARWDHQIISYRHTRALSSILLDISSLWIRSACACGQLCGSVLYVSICLVMREYRICIYNYACTCISVRCLRTRYFDLTSQEMLYRSWPVCPIRSAVAKLEFVPCRKTKATRCKHMTIV